MAIGKAPSCPERYEVRIQLPHLLAPGQNGYTVLGEFYAELRIVKDVGITVGAKGYDTPFINRNDTRMTPNTFEAVVLQGRYEFGDSSSGAVTDDGVGLSKEG